MRFQFRFQVISNLPLKSHSSPFENPEQEQKRKRANRVNNDRINLKDADYAEAICASDKLTNPPPTIPIMIVTMKPLGSLPGIKIGDEACN